MEKIPVKTIIKLENQWTIEPEPYSTLDDMKTKYLNHIVSDGIDDLNVTCIKFTPTGISREDYIIELIDDEQQASDFLKL